MLNKRSTLHENPQSLNNKGVPHIFHVNHSLENNGNMKRTDLAWVARMNIKTRAQNFDIGVINNEDEI